MANPAGSNVVVDYEDISYKHEIKKGIRAFPRNAANYVIDLFPIFQWIHRYNLMWLVRDLIAGVTVGIVVVPQSMGYAKLAELPAEYGLYTAFVGLCVYCFFGTSKDISIGPTAVMSLLLGQTIIRSTSAEGSTMTGPDIAVTFSLLAGATILFIGLVRLGILVDFIPGPVIAAFMTGSAITITFSQLKSLTGISEIDTQDPAYLILGHFFQYIPHMKLDAAFGAAGLIWLYSIQHGCQWLAKRYPRYGTAIYMFSIMRNGILVIFGTLIAFLINLGKDTSPISILESVPAGFQAMGVPNVNTELAAAVAPSLPSGVIVLILEHVAIAKSFGRMNDYTIRPSQEIAAIGFTNVVAAFFGAYPSTGSFSRTAIVSRSGVKTPLCGVFAAAVVLLALYALTPAFYYIPDSILAAVVIHAVANLVSGPKYIKRLASVSLWELFVFAVGVIVIFFTSVEYGIYASVALSIVILLFRIARPRFWALGRIPLASTATSPPPASDTEKPPLPAPSDNDEKKHQQYLYVPESNPSLGHLVEPLPPGILMCRVDESFTYPNSSYISEKIIDYCKSRTRRDYGDDQGGKVDRPWNDAGNNKDADVPPEEQAPLLHALVIDFASVNRLDSSGLQGLLDAQNTLNRYSGHHVEFHFVAILSPAIRRSLIIAGFGTQPTMHYVSEPTEVLPVVPSNNNITSTAPPSMYHASSRGGYTADDDDDDVERAMSSVSSDSDGGGVRSSNTNKKYSHHGIEEHQVEDVVADGSANVSMHSARSIPLPKDKYPFFHWSADEAVRASVASMAARNAEERQQKEEQQQPQQNQQQ